MPALPLFPSERSACGVGFVASLENLASRVPLDHALNALACVEHRGGCAVDQRTGDGAGVMTEIPYDVLGYPRTGVALGSLLVHPDPARRRLALEVFERTLRFLGVRVLDWRDVPMNVEVLGEAAEATRPAIVHVLLERPAPVRTDAAFDALLYNAKQTVRGQLKDAGAYGDLFFGSLATGRVVYKALTRSEDLPALYPDLTHPAYRTRFALFHRRFSTNTRTTWDKAQPFSFIAHNGEINTIAGNRAWSYAREQALGLRRDELLTHGGFSDSGNLNEMVEALRYRSSIQHVDDILAIMVPPAGARGGFYEFWGRAVEPWDGPAFLTFSDGATVGARLDRNGFRPCRWSRTDDLFFLGSEAGIFDVDPARVIRRGSLSAGTGVSIELATGAICHTDPMEARDNRGATFEPRLRPAPWIDAPAPTSSIPTLVLHGATRDVCKEILDPMIRTGKEAVGSMGDTACAAVLSDAPRPLSDYLFQGFAQVTNPPFDYLREQRVVDLSTHIGPRPNVFAPKELIPPLQASRLESPVASLGQLAGLLAEPHLATTRIECTFPVAWGTGGLQRALLRIGQAALDAVRGGARALVLSDRDALPDRPPVPSLLALRTVENVLTAAGLRLHASVIVDAGDVHTAHDVACAIGFGASAVCPWLALAYARGLADADEEPRDPTDRLLSALTTGLLKIMSKVGISVVRSYQGSRLFTLLGLSDEVAALFPGQRSPIGGVGFEHLAQAVLTRARLAAEAPTELPRSYRFMEHNRGVRGERHAMTAARSRLVHAAVRKGDEAAWSRYLEAGDSGGPTELRHLLMLRPSSAPLPQDDVEPASEIVRRFGSGAMSYGSISAEVQRDIFVGMRSVGARCNSGEGGENPHYFVDGTTATTKQIASARFGVTAEYLVCGDEIEIKIAQGAKPGEGGQLLGVKVDERIAQARYATAGVDLISPPPMHDIYSIEDLKQLIYELRELAPSASICVKLVAGAGIGTVAVGVVKAGADVIQISGGSGGTGAATRTSMAHAGLPWELGLLDVQQALIEHGLRSSVRLRVDGGLATGGDVVIGAALGAQEFGFGKLALIAQGCVMARICQKNRCPTGIATHDEKFLAKYQGRPADVAQLMVRLAEDVRKELARCGAARLVDVIGRGSLLRSRPRWSELVAARGLDLSGFLSTPDAPLGELTRTFVAVPSPLNARIVQDARPAWQEGGQVKLRYEVRSTDRALLTRLNGVLAERSRDLRASARAQRTEPGTSDHASYALPDGAIGIDLVGSAGQGFAAFLVGGVDVRLEGEANDSACKSMSGGRVVLVPPSEATYAAADQTILGNGALYGATGGVLLCHGGAGDRFGVRNSGATAVVESAGLHACEYMTGGVVVILGAVAANAGAGMTGGELWLSRDQLDGLSPDSLSEVDPTESDIARLHDLLTDYHAETQSRRAAEILSKGPKSADLCLLRFGSH